MPRTQKNDNFVDKSFTVMADIILKILPTNKKAKEAFVYYRDGMSAQAEGEYAEALDYYTEALEMEEDSNDRSYILYNMGLIYASNGDHNKALEFYHRAIELNPQLPQALNNIAVIYHFHVKELRKTGIMTVVKHCLIKQRIIGFEQFAWLPIITLKLKTG